jgi:SAM-dependent methyltransferase
MPIGDFYSNISERKVSKILLNCLGTLDLHTHIRLKPVLKFIESYFISSKQSTFNILELGCGSGINAFEIGKIINKLGKSLNYVGVDVSEESIKIGEKIASFFQDDNKLKFSFYCSDAISFLDNLDNYKFDIILYIDFLEHVENPEEIIKLSIEKLNDNGIFLVSVPTPQYPKIFGEKFHKKVGHLVDGYDVSELDNLFKKFNCDRLIYKYNTGLFANIGCWLYYNVFGDVRNKYAFVIKSIILYLFKFMDVFNNSVISCSLFAAYIRNNSCYGS